MRDNLTRVRDAADWWAVVSADLPPEATRPGPEDAGLLAAARDLLPEAPFDEATWGLWTKAVATATGRKGKALFMPLRLALTGRDHGPELRRLLSLIGRQRTLARLAG